MPSYITKNKHDGDPYSWIVNALDPSKLGIKIAYVKASQLNCNNVLVGKITTIELADLNKSPNFLIHISFADKKLRQEYLRHLNDIIQFPISDVNRTDKPMVTFSIPTHRMVEHIIPIFSAMNLIEAIPQNFMMYLSRFLGFNYLEEIEQAIVHELLQGCKEGPMQRPFFERACLLAKGANSPEMFAIIATFCARTFLEPYALIAAFDGLELIKNDAMIALHVSKETIDTLNFRAGIALKACNAETIMDVLKDTLFDYHLWDSKSTDTASLDTERQQLALGLLIKITDSNSKYYQDAQEALAHIFADFSESGLYSIQDKIAILGGDQVAKTLVDIAGKIKQTHLKLREKEKLLASKPESKVVNDIFTGYKIQIENLTDQLKKMEQTLQESKSENARMLATIQENEMNHAEKIQSIEKEKSHLIQKLGDVSKQLFESDEALAAQKVIMHQRESGAKVRNIPNAHSQRRKIPNLMQQVKVLMNQKLSQFNWKLIPIQAKR